MDTIRVFYDEVTGNPRLAVFNDTSWSYTLYQDNGDGTYTLLKRNGTPNGTHKWKLWETDPITPDDKADMVDFRSRWNKQDINGDSPFVYNSVTDNFDDRVGWEENVIS